MLYERERFEFIKSQWKDADLCNGKYSADHNDTEFLILVVDHLRKEIIKLEKQITDVKPKNTFTLSNNTKDKY